jgi:choline dehydrogenase-like flavoprotein
VFGYLHVPSVSSRHFGCWLVSVRHERVEHLPHGLHVNVAAHDRCGCLDIAGSVKVLPGEREPCIAGELLEEGQAPVLDPCYLAEPADLSALVAAVRMTREIGSQHALAGWRGREVAPGPGVRTGEEIAAYIRQALLSYHHQVGTCRMGVDRLAVVDPSLRVHGVPGLRVADASVMPAVTSGNTNAATITIGERCADIILTATDATARAAAAAASENAAGARCQPVSLSFARRGV